MELRYCWIEIRDLMLSVCGFMLREDEIAGCRVFGCCYLLVVGVRDLITQLSIGLYLFI